MAPFTHRLATRADVPMIGALMARAIDVLQRPFLSPAEIAASRLIMGIDTQIIDDDGYFLLFSDDRLAGCGGWSDRRTLYGGDHSDGLRDSRRLDPATDPARIRAMFTDPALARRGVGRHVLSLCETAAMNAGFADVELMATLSGQPLYGACGYRIIERCLAPPVAGTNVPLVRMGKRLCG